MMNDSQVPAPLSEPLSETTVVIVGVGLIGGSIAAALKRRGFSGRLIGVGRNASRLQAAQNAGLVDSSSTHLSEAAQHADLLVFCTPVDRIVPGVRTAAPMCRKGSLLTDVGSVKDTIFRELAGQLPQGVHFIGSHPLAGSEKQGFEHADPDLFDSRVTVVTPDASTPPDQLARLKRFWEFVGSHVVELSAEEHDRALAQTSHLPHVAAAALAAMLSACNGRLAASGFRDTTRIAAGDPALWTTILLENAEQIVNSIDGYLHTLSEFRRAVADHDAVALKKLLETAKTNRDTLVSGQ